MKGNYQKINILIDAAAIISTQGLDA